MKFLVIGGTGTVGSQVVKGLSEQGKEVHVLTHRTENLQKLPKGISGALGNLSDLHSLTAAVREFERIFLLTPLATNETELGLNAMRAIVKSACKRLVFLSIFDVEKGPHVPHFKSKIEIEADIKRSTIPYTILRPSNFFQNDFFFRDIILKEGIYPQPIGEGRVNRVDVRDIADAAVNALLQSRFENRTVSLVGPRSWSGQETAQVYSDLLGRQIKPLSDVTLWGHQARQQLPAWLVEDLKTMYAFFQRHGLAAGRKDLEESEAITGHAMRRFEDFAAEAVKQWRGAL